MISESVTKLVEEFAKLPGIGKKSAERLTYHILRVHASEALALADAIRRVKENVRYCQVCYNLSEQDQCAICRDPKRQRELLCVVEQPRDLMVLQRLYFIWFWQGRFPEMLELTSRLGRHYAGEARGENQVCRAAARCA